MSIAREHALWLSFLDISGPFLSLPTLLRVFPQGLPAPDAEVTRELRLAYQEWLDAPDNPAIHRAWVRFVLERTLEIAPEYIAEGQAISEALKWSSPGGETFRPDYAILPPSPVEEGAHVGTQVLKQSASQHVRGVRAIIHLLPRDQRLDKPPIGSRTQDSMMTRVMELLRATGVNLALVTNGEQWMLITSPQVSGGTTGFVSWYASLWLEEPVTLRAFRALLGMARFFGVADADTLEEMLKASADDQYELTDQLGKQVRHAVEVLVRAIDRENQNRHGKLLEGIGEAELYEAAVTVMMRLVFMLAAEERDLFSLKNPLYAENYAVSTLRANLRETGDQYGEELLERRFDAWCRLLAAFRVVYAGVDYQDMQFRAYGGSLFDPDRYPFLEGRITQGEGREAQGAGSWRTELADPLPITNRDVLYILESLQLLKVKLPGGSSETRRLSFRALDIEQIGDIYQTLLDHTAVRAQEPVLGLVGTKHKEPEVALSTLENLRAKGADALVEFLHEQTGKRDSALLKLLSEQALDEALRDTNHISRVQAACGNDAELFVRVRPLIPLVRADDFGAPVIILPNSVFVTAGMSRRQTQSHYTPRSLTEPLVKHTLDPLIYVGPAEGLPEAEWKLKSARELLQLKICDMAMGSASILVQTVRYLGDRLVEAWADDERRMTDDERRTIEPSTVFRPPSSVMPRITPDGSPSTGAANEELIPLEYEERKLLARRIVASRCIYGVDKNPLAVELAKLSLWLVTLDANRAFTFLDHALKCGDSLVGADEDMFLRWAHTDKSPTMPLFVEQLQKQLDTARAKRRELEAFDVRDVRDAARKQHLLDEAHAALANIKLGCDILVGARLLKLKDKERAALLNRALLDYVAGKPFENAETQRAYDAARKVRAFNWFAEFPEVFDTSSASASTSPLLGGEGRRGEVGFDAFVGNPPFLGGTRVSTMAGKQYLEYLHSAYPSFRDRADLCSLFFLRGFALLQGAGFIGLLATNTISQGDTRVAGLDEIVGRAGKIYRAISSIPWPGTAGVVVSVVHISKSPSSTKIARFLDERTVAHISAHLDVSLSPSSPNPLQVNSGKSFSGSKLDGTGFILSKIEAAHLLTENTKNKDVVFPFLTGQDFNTFPDHSASRWVINFFDWDKERACKYQECFEILRERVYPERQNHSEERTRRNWWQFQRVRPELYEAISRMERVLCKTRHSPNFAFAFTTTSSVFQESLVILTIETFTEFSVLSSTLHESWAWKFGSTLGSNTLRYNPTDCFETFPFPISNLQSLSPIGEAYHEHRRQLMLARQEGLTATYNRFHNPKEKSADIQRLRELHVEMDNAVAAAYGWSELELAHGFHETAQGIRFTISDEARREVLARLLRLNHERYEEEVREGLHEKKTRERRKTDDGGRTKVGGGGGDKGSKKGKKRSVREEMEGYSTEMF